MNDPSPESALAECMALVSKPTDPRLVAGITAACANFIATHGAHFAALAAECSRLNTVIGVYHDRLYAAEVKAEIAEAERDAAVRLLKECRPHVVSTKRCLPDSDEGDYYDRKYSELLKRIDAATGKENSND